MKNGLSPVVISGYCLTRHDKRLCIFYRPAKHLGSNNRKRGLFIFNTHTGRVEKRFEDIERLSPTQVHGHYIFVDTRGFGAHHWWISNLKVLDTRNSKIREIRLGKGVPLPWNDTSLSNLKWVDWNLLGWGPRHHFFYVYGKLYTVKKYLDNYFALALGHNGVTVRDCSSPYKYHLGGNWTLFRGNGNNEMIDVSYRNKNIILNKRMRRVISLHGQTHYRLIRAATGKVLAIYSTRNNIACSPDGKQICVPYKIPGVQSRFLAIIRKSTQKVVQLIAVGQCTESYSNYSWTPDGKQIMIETSQVPNFRKPEDGWGITFASVANGKISHFIPSANWILTQFSDNGRYAYVLNLGGKADNNLLCIDLNDDKVVYKSVLPVSFYIGQKARVIPSPGKVVFVAVGHTVFEVNASSGHLLGKLANMDPYVGHDTISKDGRRIYLATYHHKAFYGATGLVAISTYSGRIVRKFALPEIRIEIPPKYQGGGDGGAFFGY
ncbi:MAG: hypothetical protein M0Z50_12140 [Planctomycetia bacterium]|nr:hypothetical protein [Planctomycetia bacterium]